MENLINDLTGILVKYGLMVIGALIILLAGIWVSKQLTNLVIKLLYKKEVDDIVVKFVASLIKTALYIVIILATLGQLGIETTSFIALIGAAGLAIGFALQGSLSNFAAGVVLIIFRPFKAGDFIQTAGESGVVETIHLFITTIITIDNRTIFIPNSKITNDNIINYSTKPTRRVDMIFGIGYGDDIDKAKKIISDILENDKRVLKDPPFQVVVSELADSSVNISVRPWVNTADYWNLYFDVTEKIKKSFDELGVSIPFPQTDVHLFKKN